NNNSPSITGTADSGSTVRLYTTSDCSGTPVVNGSAALFASPGLAVTVADNSSTTYKATATDAANNTSACSARFTYPDDSTAPAPHTLRRSTPPPPANNNSPSITGTADSGSTVKLYTTSDCSGTPAANGSAAAFASPGLAVTVGDNTSMTYKATATDVSGNT